MTDKEATAIRAIERPEKVLLHYYLLTALATGPLFPIVGLVLYFRYHTMRYRFTDEGLSMRWGILFRREIIIQYARIQDIHLRSNVVERWLGLGRVLIQTASGSSGAEMTLEGILIFEQVRDYLYTRMRGVGDGVRSPAAAGGGTELSTRELADLAATLREVSAELRALRETWAVRKGDV